MDTHTEDTVYLTCQSCGSIHTIGDDGELELVEDKREGSKGINGIRTHTVGGESWRQEQYLATEPKQYQVPAMMIALDKASMRQSAAPPVEDKEYSDADPSVLEANNKDLKDRNITN